MEVKLEKITPARAKELLRNNSKNRKLRPRIVNGYIQQMKSGDWQGETGEAISISKNHNILNGQHRLTAIATSGITQMMLMAYDVPEEAFKVIDTGLKRTGGDALYVEGVKNANQLAGIIRAYRTLKAGVVSDRAGAANSGVFNTDILSEYEAKPRFWQNVNHQITLWYMAFFRTLKPSAIAAHYLTFRDKSKEDADKFFDKLTSGTGMGSSNPIMQLRNILISDRASRMKLPTPDKYALIIKAWNLFRDGKTVSKLTYDPSKEDFPKPR